MLRIATTTVFLFLFVLALPAQINDKQIERAIKKFENKEYIAAIQQFKKLYTEDPKAYIPLKYIANSYRKINEYDKAEIYYNLVVNSVHVEAEDHLNYGQALRANGKLAAAVDQFEKFAAKSQNKLLSNLLIQSINTVETWENEPKNFVSSAGEGLNSEHSEYGFLAFKDKYYITSNREKNFNSPEAFTWDGSAFMSVFEIDTAKLLAPGAEFVSVPGRLNTEYHDGPMTVNKAGDKLVIMRIDNQLRGKNFVNKMKLYEGVYEGGKWKSFKPLPFNSDEYSSGHPAYGENEDVLYFMSDKEGGFGGMDLYKSVRVDGKWQTPENLGATINTSRNESFPYYRNGKLYFASNGFSGYGGYDIFVSEYGENAWQSPVNLKNPINSPRDDFGIYFLTDSTGYYASNRVGGMGEDDIYSFIYSTKALSVGITGIFEYKSLPVEGTKIVIVDKNDSIVFITYTDEQGRFKFTNLPYDESVLLRIDTEDKDLLKDGRLYLTDENGDKIKLIQRLRNGKFTFKALPPDETKQLALMELEDSKLVNSFAFEGKVFKKLPGDFAQEMMVYLVDDEGRVVDSMLTDKSGNFNFKKLGLDNGKNYFVQMAIEDPDLNIAFINEEGRFYKMSSAVDGKFVLSDEEKANLNNGFTGIIAKLEAFGKALPFTRVDIYDKNNKLIATVISNEFGEFQFNKLAIDEEYYFTVPDLEDETRLNTKLYVIDGKGDELYLIRQLKEGKFFFIALPMDEYEKLRFLEESLVPRLVELKGQIFKKLPGDFNYKSKVYLVDEGGNIIDSVYTNSTGQFNFEKLNPDRNYSFRLAENQDLNLALLDEENKIIEQAIINERGNFVYKKLTYQVANFEPLEEVDAALFEDELTHQIRGQVYQKLPGDFDKGMEVYIYNEAGELVGTTFTDANGNFTFKKLKADQNYYFRIEHSDEDFQLLTLDNDNNVLNKTIKNEKGHFKYHKLGTQEHSLLIEDEIDHHQVLYFDTKKIELDEFTVYYRFDSVLLNTVSKLRLKSFADLIKGQEFFTEVHSYTDTRGSEEYNRKLSKERTDNVIAYLISQGVDKEKIGGNYYGELSPVVDCETKKCNNEDHALNRRTVVKLKKLE